MCHYCRDFFFSGGFHLLNIFQVTNGFLNSFFVLELLFIFSHTLALILSMGLFGVSEFHEMVIDKVVIIGKGGFFTNK